MRVALRTYAGALTVFPTSFPFSCNRWVYTLLPCNLRNGRFKKVWHNYSFDARVMFRMWDKPSAPFMPLGFAGDTMHMAQVSFWSIIACANINSVVAIHVHNQPMRRTIVCQFVRESRVPQYIFPDLFL
jgi:hypothetical protein